MGDCGELSGRKEGALAGTKGGSKREVNFGKFIVYTAVLYALIMNSETRTTCVVDKICRFGCRDVFVSLFLLFLHQIFIR